MEGRLPLINVRGLQWKISSIRTESEGGFSSDLFRRILKVVGRDADFVWVDVACIPQAPTGGDIQGGAEGAHLAPRPLDDGPAAKYRHSEQLRPEGPEGFRKLLESKWFSSLWTLQEAFLRKDAEVLSRSGNSVSIVASPGGESEVVMLQTIMNLVDTLLHGPQSYTFYGNLRYSGIEP
ncbi:hypothetical protein GGTG_00740 [Gaeumannomyces tritici R3-111a-1]|uniref:Heterokaryon incompatibility domain-containing protein n=1 Tax=Gaeumannomyces tritici (strain R3-111a-1) TaxID=644352 RepID=J3NHK3_GAET3|nr:hypothetical protein GGTG_00740 [Gaeumannomyces tritici R3-111a-1]EJT80746.1 hypothetical protein GGTG_00740 [Gaeumannomyces tritici R3-111a-1]